VSRPTVCRPRDSDSAGKGKCVLLDTLSSPLCAVSYKNKLCCYVAMSVQRHFISSRWQNKFERRIKNVEVAMVYFKQVPEHFHGVTEENI
jgi:hypothetical protein